MRLDRALFGHFGTARGPGSLAPRSVGETGFASQLELPLACDVLERPPCEQMRDAAEQANADILAFLLHDIDVGAAPRVADEQLEEALKPIRTKLDIAIGMLARLSYRGIELPARCRIELGERQIAWTSDCRLHPGVWLRIAIYFDAKFREPVILFGQATGAEPLDGGRYRNEAELAPIFEPTIGDLARLALLVQRRQQTRRDGETTVRARW
jgi:hypothetical protein